MPDEYSVQPVIRRDDVEQPAHGRLLEARTAGRMNAFRPSGRDIASHAYSVAGFEQDFYILSLR
jgi:hypothetical protein